MSKKAAPDSITLTYNLHELPTAQHRAGLAGLILQIDSMGPTGYKRASKSIPTIEVLEATSAKITFTPDSVQGLFDEVYAAKLVEVIVANKWQGKATPKPGEFFLTNEDPKSGALKRVPGFAYDVTRPLGLCLKQQLTGQGNAWLELWRQMLWSVPRGGNNVRARAPFIDRAAGRPCGVGTAIWAQLVEDQKLRSKSRMKISGISGALMLGAQTANADRVQFSGRVDQNLLLHFWQLVVLTFVPMVVNKKEKKSKPLGYVLAIPDVADLIQFRDVFPEIIQELRADHPTRTPARARIELPEQGGLEVLRRIKAGVSAGGRKTTDECDAEVALARAHARLAKSSFSNLGGQPESSRGMHQALASDKSLRLLSGCVRAVESYHMLKLKRSNDTKMLSFSRVADRAGLVEEYERIAGNYRNPLFRAALLRALIRGQPWHGGMIELFAKYPWSFFVEGDETPKYLPRFGRDGREKFQASRKDTSDMSIDAMNQEERTKRLSEIIQRLVYKYIEGRAASKLGIKLDKLPTEIVDGKKRRVYPDLRKFREYQVGVCSDAFLSMRSRHDQDFVEFFAGSICSVAQYLPPEDFRFLTKILMTAPDPSPIARQGLTRDDIKAIAMVAVSACSFQVRPRDTKP